MCGGLKRNVVVGQSGGPTCAINATLSGVVRGACGKVDKIFGMKNGILGLLQNNLIELNFLLDNKELLSSLELTPSAVLGSCRFKLPSDFNSFVYQNIFECLDRNNIGCVFYIGGNDSMDTVCKLNEYAREKSVDVSIIGIPKTIDNDLVMTHHCPGYGSAAKYVATTVYEIARDVSVYDLPSVTVVEVMGRDAGWLGCAAGLSQYHFNKGSDLVYLPEKGFSLDAFLGDLENLLRRKNNVLVSVCEGVSFKGGNSEKDPFGHKSLSGIGKVLESNVKNKIGCKARSIELNLPQRCAGHLVSRADILNSVRLGSAAVDVALSGKSGEMVTFHVTEFASSGTLSYVEASLVANKIRHVPTDFIEKGEKFITKKCVEYVSPLIEGEMNIRYEMGLPHHFDLGGYLCTE